ncbi:BolA protein [Natronospira proteinivora]|uniref:BolA protein n=1 Tax=Natronospira proteinivora TaxID=1807133 RepID=A0ABT1G6M7_9GAMM|nr:BolA family protein [Natronospira proteinivora]MCP1726951.1 BolA protein [Natronospira proteinivora]
MSNPERIEKIRARLQEALQPEALDIRDDSHLHVGHPGARDGRGHFHVRIVAQAFEGQRTLARHRQVYEALDSLMESDIHALQIQAQTPDE